MFSPNGCRAIPRSTLTLTVMAPSPHLSVSIQARVARGERVLMFDGVCSLCNGFVDFVISRDKAGTFAFASLQSEPAQAFLADAGREASQLLDTVVLADRDGIHMQSTAVLRVLRALRGPWAPLYGFIAVPASLRDAVYRAVAARRYRWFGKRETCRLPTPQERARFV